jgi:murein DD-endopeptidase MepM/ murein hydrolase activator NlpD
MQHMYSRLYQGVKILISSSILLALLLSIIGVPVATRAAADQSLSPASSAAASASQQTSSASHAATAPAPFLHRPYYGSRTVSQRTTSFVDHDKPWYVNDGIFVRYDGAKWTNVSIGSCTGGVNCYDGHNGYDLNLWYEPVLSADAGTVIRAGWYDDKNHQVALGLWAAVDHGNGYVTAYGHLSALTVYCGEQVGTQWQVGTSGTSGSSTGPHLHFATYYYPSWNATDPFGWTGNYPDPNIVPDYYLWVSNPGATGAVPDLSATGSAVYPGAALVDDGGAGWSSTGTWTASNGGTDINGDLHWASTTSGSASATTTWQPHLPSDGYYEVGVYVDDNHASSSWAPYTITSADPTNPGATVSHTVYVDETHIGSFQGPFGWENTGPQWIGLGTYYFRTSLPARVTLSNATGENGLQLAADGMEFVPDSLQPPPTTDSYAFSITGDGTPSALLPGATTPVTMTLANTGNFTWTASGAGAVQVLYRWLTAQKQVVLTGQAALPQDVGMNASVTVAVPVQAPSQAGAYTLQWDMEQGTKAFSQMGAQVVNDSVEVARYAESFSALSMPGVLTPGASMHLSVNVQNRGAITWPATGSSQVTLGYHWLDSSGKPINPALVSSLSQGQLPADVPPGGSASIPIVINTPVLAGNYKLVFDCQQQGTWFSSQGATPLTGTVTITPNLPRTYYFAEGYTGTGTTEYLSLTNPSATGAHVSITYVFANATEKTRTYTVAAQSHSVLNINNEVGPNQTVSMIVQGDQPFVAERSMYTQKGALVAATDSIGSTQLSNTWYFAEGNTTAGWNTLLAVLNPSASPVTLKISFLWSLRGLNGFLPRSRSYTMPAHARSTIVLNSAAPGQQFGMAITASATVVVERAEYLVQGPLRGGSAVMGAASPQARWYFGAGSTAAGMMERLILANPSPGWVTARVSYLTTTGQVITQAVGIPGLNRVVVNVNAAVKQATHATVIIANGPIVAERQDCFNNVNAAQGSTTIMGASSAYASWYFARGTTAAGTTASLAIANPGSISTPVQIIYYQAHGAPIIKTYTLPADTRLSVNMTADAGASNTVGIAIYATTPIVVEQATFFHANGASGEYAAMGFGV